eukprot:1477058-Heterocapsa_arctica.AAC.1
MRRARGMRVARALRAGWKKTNSNVGSIASEASRLFFRLQDVDAQAGVGALDVLETSEHRRRQTMESRSSRRPPAPATGARWTPPSRPDAMTAGVRAWRS